MIARIVKDTGGGVRRGWAILKVPRSSYYLAATPSRSAQRDGLTGDRIKTIFQHHRRRYRCRRSVADLMDQGWVCAASRVRRLMRERGLKASNPRLTRRGPVMAGPTSHRLTYCSNQPLPNQPDEVWAGDITSIPCERGWLYLALVIDLCTRRIIDWALAEHQRGELVIQALEQALGSRPRHCRAIFRSDRGDQYGSGGCRALLSRSGLRQSLPQCMD